MGAGVSRVLKAIDRRKVFRSAHGYNWFGSAQEFVAGGQRLIIYRNWSNNNLFVKIVTDMLLYGSQYCEPYRSRDSNVEKQVRIFLVITFFVSIAVSAIFVHTYVSSILTFSYLCTVPMQLFATKKSIYKQYISTALNWKTVTSLCSINVLRRVSVTGGGYKPDCSGSDKFELSQFSESGYKWCADPTTGN